jgi:aspartate kinase
VATHITVVKFGGTSIENGAAFARVAKVVKRRAKSGLVVIVSAMSGVTNTLIDSFQNAASRGVESSLALLEEHFSRHVQVAEQLIPARVSQTRKLIDRIRIEIAQLLANTLQNSAPDMRMHDAIASYGERLAADLMTMVLQEHGVAAVYVDARRCVITNDEHGNAEPLFDELRQHARAELLPLVKTKRVPVLGGFFGATTSGVTTTLGRGSSDYSATLIGSALDAREVQIWTDVDGIQTADPRLVKSTRTVPHVSYEEASHLAKLGARVMHPKMIEPVVLQGIPIRILNSHAPRKRGTLISAKPANVSHGFKAIAHKVAGRSAVVGFVGHGLKINFRVEPDSVGAVVRQLHEMIFEL